jgi:hypothetical protein
MEYINGGMRYLKIYDLKRIAKDKKSAYYM